MDAATFTPACGFAPTARGAIAAASSPRNQERRLSARMSGGLGRPKRRRHCNEERLAADAQRRGKRQDHRGRHRLLPGKPLADGRLGNAKALRDVPLPKPAVLELLSKIHHGQQLKSAESFVSIKNFVCLHSIFGVA